MTTPLDLRRVSRAILEELVQEAHHHFDCDPLDSLVRIRAEAAGAPEPVLCHPTDPCVHGITGPCSKCQPTPLQRTRAEVDAEIATEVRDYAPNRLDEPRCLLALQRLAAEPTRPDAPRAVTVAERAVLRELSDVPSDTLDAVLGTPVREWLKRVCVAELARRATARGTEGT